MGRKLAQSFYKQSTSKVAEKLIGQILVRKFSDGRILRSVITETEAYLGLEDKACHTYGGRRTSRTEVMWGPAGKAYVYFIYGMYFCLNAVTRDSGEPEAVLIRGARPLEDKRQIPLWLEQEPRVNHWAKIMSGPGKLCRVLDINKTHNGISLQSDELWIEQGFTVPTKMILKTPRIGIAYSQEAQDWPLRFLWSSGGLYESVFRYHANYRKNSAGKNAKDRI